MNNRILLGAALIVCVLTATAAGGPPAKPPAKSAPKPAGPAYDLRYRPTVGLRMAYEESMDTSLEMDAATRSNRTANQKERFHRQLVVTEDRVTDVVAGEVAARRITFGPNCWWASKKDEQPASKTRLVYAGKSVNFHVTPDGKIEQDFGVQPKGELLRLLRNQILGRTALFAGKPVTVGERWRADEALRTLLDLRSTDTISAIFTLKSVRKQEGRDVAEIGMSAGVIAAKDGFNLEMELEGTFVTDVETGVVLKTDMTGKSRLAGLAMYGIVHVTGGGSLELHHNGRLLPSDAGAVAGNGE